VADAERTSRPAHHAFAGDRRQRRPPVRLGRGLRAGERARPHLGRQRAERRTARPAVSGRRARHSGLQERLAAEAGGLARRPSPTTPPWSISTAAASATSP
jgi:hypothetical protein